MGFLYNTRDERAVGSDVVFEMSNATLSRGGVQGASRYGNVSSWSGYDASDVGLGIFYAEYGGVSEILAIINDAGTVKAFSVDSGGTWTAITRNSPPSGEDPQNIDPSGTTAEKLLPFFFTQYLDKILCFKLGTDTAYVRVIGGGTTEEQKWRLLRPQFLYTTSADVSTDRPPYSELTMSGSDTLHYIEDGTGAINDPSPGYSAPQTRNGYLAIPIGSEDFRRTGNLGGDNLYRALVVWTPNTPFDLTESDALTFRVHRHEATGNLPSLNYAKIRFSSDGSTTPTLAWVNAINGLNCQYRLEGQEWVFWADLSELNRLNPTLMGDVKRIIFEIDSPNWTGHLFDSWIHDVFAGGVALHPFTEEPTDIEYAYDYYDPTGSTEATGAKLVKLPRSEAQGESPASGLPGAGVHTKIEPTPDPTLNGLGYARIRIYRRTRTFSNIVSQEPEGGEWKLISGATVINNSGTPSYVDKLRERELASLPTYDLQFSDSIAGTSEFQAIGIWKQSLALSIDQRVHFSFPGRPFLFLPAPEDLLYLPDEEEFNLGRTLYMSQGRIESVYGIVGQDPCYLIGDRHVYAMIGDYAGTATPPRPLPGSRGVTSRSAFAAWEGGVLVASYDALWFYRVNRAFSSSPEDNTYRLDMTRLVRKSYDRLYGTSGDNLVVIEHDDEVWMFNTYTSDSTTPGRGVAGGTTHTRYMKLGKAVDEQRPWEEGTFPSVASATASRATGLKVQLSDGRIADVSTPSSPTQYTTDNGTAVNFSASTGRIRTGRQAVTALSVYADGTPTVTLTTYDGARGAATQTFVVNKEMQPNVNIRPGAEYKLTVSGVTGRDAVFGVGLTMEPAGPGYGD